MKRRILFAGIAGTLLVTVIAVFLVLRSLDAIVEDAIERSASAAAQVPVRVQSVRIGLSAGSATINGLTIANPPGFSGAQAFSLERIQVTVDRSTILSNPIRINEVAIVTPKVFFELDQAGEANVDVIRRNIEKYDAPGDESQPAETAPTPLIPAETAPADGFRFTIQTLSIQGAELDIDAAALSGEQKTVKLPDTRIYDVGRHDGASGPEIAQLVVLALARDVATTVAAVKIETLIAEKIGGKTGKALGETVGEAVRELGGALNKILND